MRHLGSLALSLILAPVIAVLTGFGRNKSSFGAHLIDMGENSDRYLTFGLGVAMLVGAGALCGVLLLLPLSPLGPAFAGALLTGTGIWVLLDPSWLAGHRDLGRITLSVSDVVLNAPMMITLGLALAVSAFHPRRWRRPRTLAAGATSAVGGAGAPPAPSSGGYPDPDAGYPLASAFPSAYPAVPALPQGFVGTLPPPPIAVPSQGYAPAATPASAVTAALPAGGTTEPETTTALPVPTSALPAFPPQQPPPARFGSPASFSGFTPSGTSQQQSAASQQPWEG